MGSIKTPDLWLPAELWEQMLADVERRAPIEACGLVAGRDSQASSVFPVTNVLNSPVRYRMDPAEQLKAFLEMERDGLELLAIYHSHPTGPQQPSITDIDEAYYPEAIYLIWSPDENGWQCQSFWIQDAVVRPARTLVD